MTNPTRPGIKGSRLESLGVWNLPCVRKKTIPHVKRAIFHCIFHLHWTYGSVSARWVSSTGLDFWISAKQLLETLLNSSESIKRLSCIYGMDYTYLSLQLCSSMFAVYESLHIKLTHRIHVWYIYLNTFIIYQIKFMVFVGKYIKYAIRGYFGSYTLLKKTKVMVVLSKHLLTGYLED